MLQLIDRTGKADLVRPTCLDVEPHGICASWDLYGPNGIGLSIVQLVRQKGNIFVIEGADMLGKTPLLVMKLYIASYDAIASGSQVCTTGKELREKSKRKT